MTLALAIDYAAAVAIELSSIEGIEQLHRSKGKVRNVN